MYNSDCFKWYIPSTSGEAAEDGGDSAIIMGGEEAAVSDIGKNQNCLIWEGNE